MEENLESKNDPLKNLIEKISALPPEKVAEVEDFVDFLRGRDETTTAK